MTLTVSTRAAASAYWTTMYARTPAIVTRTAGYARANAGRKTMGSKKDQPIDYQEAYEILRSDTTWQKLAEFEYYGGPAILKKTIKTVEEACIVACEAIQELQTLKSQMDDDLESLISELKQAKFDVETFWEEPTALSKAFQNAIRALIEIQQYKKLGTLEEIRTAIERQKSRKVRNRKVMEDFRNNPYSFKGDCPICGVVEILSIHTDYCHCCGQKLDWSVSEC